LFEKPRKIQSIEDQNHPLFLETLYVNVILNSVKNHQEFSRKSILKAPPGAFVLYESSTCQRSGIAAAPMITGKFHNSSN
jgi:hypothetical protein